MLISFQAYVKTSNSFLVDEQLDYCQSVQKFKKMKFGQDGHSSSINTAMEIQMFSSHSQAAWKKLHFLVELCPLSHFSWVEPCPHDLFGSNHVPKVRSSHVLVEPCITSPRGSWPPGTKMSFIFQYFFSTTTILFQFLKVRSQNLILAQLWRTDRYAYSLSEGHGPWTAGGDLGNLISLDPRPTD